MCSQVKIAWVWLIWACIVLGGCQPTTGGDFCKTYEKIVQGKLKLTRSEISALRRMTKNDIAALKIHYQKNCK